MRIIVRLATAALIIYTLLFGGLLVRSEMIAGPTRGGIAPHEVLEGYAPGGLITLLYIWIGLVVLAASTLILKLTVNR